MGTGPASMDTVSPVPTDPQELEERLSDRNCDLRNAIEFGNPGLVGQIGHLRSAGWPFSRQRSRLPDLIPLFR